MSAAEGDPIYLGHRLADTARRFATICGSHMATGHSQSNGTAVTWVVSDIDAFADHRSRSVVTTPQAHAERFVAVIAWATAG